ncbi:hypothetical protein Acr_07g0015430 [Actinidia rufa]|uniref:Uncharacterized protein n=1 Tax=Actinidia rufa TaxID=165716 RepID=A0A7J0F0D6_9ERIC|nr:hypothetical protein Acr_07g0015430 [Actinidia rufa]
MYTAHHNSRKAKPSTISPNFEITQTDSFSLNVGWRASDKGAERGGEAVGGGNSFQERRQQDEGEERAVEVQQDIRVQLEHQAPIVPHALHLHHQTPLGTRLRR